MHLWDVSALLEEDEGDESAGKGDENGAEEDVAVAQVLQI